MLNLCAVLLYVCVCSLVVLCLKVCVWFVYVLRQLLCVFVIYVGCWLHCFVFGDVSLVCLLHELINNDVCRLLTFGF